MSVDVLRPFWRYYGGKWRAAPHYPAPTHATIIEPFAGAAGYSLRYPDRQVVLVEKYPTICEMWRWLIGTTAAEVRRIPEVDNVDDLPGWVPAGARMLVGFSLQGCGRTPSRRLTAHRKAQQARRRRMDGWTQSLRERVASQVEHIRHWRIIEGDYTAAPDVEATWFIDPPYSNYAGRHYVHHRLDYAKLAAWCRTRRGQALVCEHEGADWLPFTSLGEFLSGPNRRTKSKEAIWTQGMSAP